MFSALSTMSDNESEDLPPPDKFGKFLMFGDEIAPVFDALTIEQVRRRLCTRGLFEPHGTHGLATPQKLSSTRLWRTACMLSPDLKPCCREVIRAGRY